MKLYEITNQFKILDDFVPEIESVDDANAYTELFSSLQLPLAEKVEGCVHVIKNAEADIYALASEIKRMQAKKKALENKVENVRNYIFYNLKEINQDHVKAGLFDVKIAKTPESVKISNEELLSESFFRIKKEVDKTAIKEAIKAGQFVSGATLEAGETLRIK